MRLSGFYLAIGVYVVDFWQFFFSTSIALSESLKVLPGINEDSRGGVEPKLSNCFFKNLRAGFSLWRSIAVGCVQQDVLPVLPIASSSLEPLLNEGFQLMKMPFVSSIVAISTLMAGLLIFGCLGATVIPADDGPLVLFQAPQTTSEAAEPNVSVGSASHNGRNER